MRRKLYAAIDLHSRTSVLGWMTASGEMLTDDRRFPTTEENLRREVKDLPAREIHLTIEACPLARWAAGILRPLVAELIVCDPRENRLIARSSAKRDEMDVRALCRLLRMGELHPVWMSDDAGRQRFREAVYNLLKMRDQQRELKALIKIRYQAKGILGLNGREIFHPEKRARWLEQLHREDRGGMEAVYVLFDTALRLWNEQLARQASDPARLPRD